MTPSYPLNQFAPTAQQGVAMPPSQVVGYEERPYDYVYAPPGGSLTALQQINPDTLAIQTDADFMLLAWYISLATGQFQIQLTDATGYQLQSGSINSLAISTSAADPTVFSPMHPFPAGSKILINIQDLSNATNSIQLIFKGKKLYRVDRSSPQRR